MSTQPTLPYLVRDRAAGTQGQAGGGTSSANSASGGGGGQAAARGSKGRATNKRSGSGKGAGEESESSEESSEESSKEEEEESDDESDAEVVVVEPDGRASNASDTAAGSSLEGQYYWSDPGNGIKVNASDLPDLRKAYLLKRKRNEQEEAYNARLAKKGRFWRSGKSNSAAYDICAFDAVEGETRCLSCRKEFTGNFSNVTSTIGKHVKTQHPQTAAALRLKIKTYGWYRSHDFAPVVAGEGPRAKPGTLDQHPGFRQITPREEKELHRYFAAAVCLDGEAFSMGERRGMTMLVNKLRPGFNPPSRRTVGRHLKHMHDGLLLGMSKAFASLPVDTFFAAAIDLWDTKGSMISFNGMVLYFIDDKYNKYVVTVGVEHVPGKHDVNAVLDGVRRQLTGVGLSGDRLLAMSTDGGSNMPGVVEALGCHRIWCFCHRLQLVIKVRVRRNKNSLHLPICPTLLPAAAARSFVCPDSLRV